MLMCPFDLNPEDITGDYKLVGSSEEDMLLHQSILTLRPTVSLCLLSGRSAFIWHLFEKRLFFRCIPYSDDAALYS